MLRPGRRPLHSAGGRAPVHPGRALRAALIGALAALAAPAAAHAQATAFYDPPSPLPSGRPGDVIRSEVMPTVGPTTGIATARRVLYRSEDAKGNPTAVSGVVLTPTAKADGPRPVVGWAPGTMGMADRCAPSLGLQTGQNYEAAAIAQALQRGWVVAVTDYQGLGTPGEHAYAVGRALGRNQLDVVRAARRLPGSQVPADGPAGVIGYSEGGGATAWAAQLAGSYAPDLGLDGAGVGGIIGDPAVVGRSLDGGPFTTFLLYAAIGLDTSYPELNLAKYLNDLGRAGQPLLKNSCVVDGIPLGAGQRSSTFTTSNPLDAPDWQARLRENTVGVDGEPAAPTQVAHTRLDNVLPYGQAVDAVDRWCARGANVRLVDAPGVDHLSGFAGATPLSMDFLAARFAGTPIDRPAACARASDDDAAADASAGTLRIGFPGPRSAKRRGVRTARASLRASRDVRSVVLTLRRADGRHLATKRLTRLDARRTRRFSVRLRPRAGLPRGVLRARATARGANGRVVAVRRIRLAR